MLVKLAGSPPTPGWKLVGFTLERGAGENELVLTPHSEPPKGPALQVLSPFQGVAAIIGLKPGVYRIRARGRGPERAESEVTVLPAGLVVRLRTTGGIMGLDELITLYENGVAKRVANKPAEERMFHLHPDTLRAVDERLPTLEGDDASPSRGADLFEHELGWWSDDEWHSIKLDSVSANGTSAGELIALLRGLR